ncbi:MAG: aldehyde dehydrogenase family protein [Hornefia sp.]|nr:aldehyde dehydrogenase family protein [Hornefia sp.]
MISGRKTTNIHDLVLRQKEYFETLETDNIGFRTEHLKKLKKTILKHEAALLDAMEKDLGKHPQEFYMMEMRSVMEAIKFSIKHVRRLARRKHVPTPLIQFGKSKILYEPYGTVLVIAPFNYPFSLAMEPLIAALSAGNTVILKPSELTPNVSSVISDIIRGTFDPFYVASVQGDAQVTTELLSEKPDYIFFTGSPKIGKLIMSKASENLIPVTLELGGKSPVILDSSANIPSAAKRIIWGKTVNSGQTCIAPDYVLVPSEKKDELISEMKKVISLFYGTNITGSNSYGKIVNERHWQRVNSLISSDERFIVHGGSSDKDSLYIEPTLLDIPIDMSHQAATMQEEIFAPLLPVIPYENIEDAISLVKTFEKPLALYIFSKKKAFINKLISNIKSGGVSINDTLKHVSIPDLPFGGIGSSGMGAYHGEYGFMTFSHQRAVYQNKTFKDLPMLFPPYTKNKLNSIKKISR